MKDHYVVALPFCCGRNADVVFEQANMLIKGVVALCIIVPMIVLIVFLVQILLK